MGTYWCCTSSPTVVVIAFTLGSESFQFIGLFRCAVHSFRVEGAARVSHGPLPNRTPTHPECKSSRDLRSPDPRTDPTLFSDAVRRDPEDFGLPVVRTVPYDHRRTQTSSRDGRIRGDADLSPSPGGTVQSSLSTLLRYRGGGGRTFRRGRVEWHPRAVGVRDDEWPGRGRRPGVARRPVVSRDGGGTGARGRSVVDTGRPRVRLGGPGGPGLGGWCAVRDDRRGGDSGEGSGLDGGLTLLFGSTSTLPAGLGAAVEGPPS